MLRLTKEFVESIPVPAKGSVTEWDDAITGFGVRVYSTGTRSFFINYWIDGRERRRKIGVYPEWSVAAARERAKELRRQVDAGGDPAGEKRERREAPSIKDLLDRYVAEHLVTKTAGSVSPKLAAQRRKDEEAMLAEIGQRLGLATKVADVHHGDVKQMHQDISASIGERTGRPRPVRANRILAVCSKAFSLSLVPQAGENKPWRDAAAGNPCKGVARNREEGKEQFYSGTELAIIGDVLADHGKDAQEPGRSVAKAAADAARLAMFTGARPQEVIFGTWPQFDAEPGYWVKPSAHTKQRKVHKLPLSPPALERIERLRKERKGAHWLFPGAKGKPVAAFWHMWSAVQVALWRASRDPNVAAIVADLESALGRRPSAELCRKEAKRRNLTLPQNRLYDLRHTGWRHRGRRRPEPAYHRQAAGPHASANDCTL
jgi:integrase